MGGSLIYIQDLHIVLNLNSLEASFHTIIGQVLCQETSLLISLLCFGPYGHGVLVFAKLCDFVSSLGWS